MDRIDEEIGSEKNTTGTEESESTVNLGGIIAARGTAEGLVLRLDGRVAEAALSSALSEFVESRRRFLSGNSVALEWIGEMPSEEVSGKIRELLTDNFGIEVRASSFRESVVHFIKPITDDFESEDPVVRTKAKVKGGDESMTGLFGGIDAFSASEERTRIAFDSNLWDDANSRVIFATLRSGQKIETEHSIVVFGDVNSGAEIVAGGDILVMGTLRGVAHAGAYDETGGGRIICALNMQPTQLRIGAIISRGAAQERRHRNRGVEVARVDGDVISVEPYQAKSLLSWKRD